jgi:hypothetical protein
MATVLQASLRGGAELRRTAAVLRAAGREDLRRDVGRAVRAEGQPTLNDLKSAARRVNITGVRAGGKPFTAATRAKHLRERIANATVLEVRTAGSETRVTFHTVASRMGDAKVIPRYADLGRPWRHPIMGRRARWASSRGESWFWPPIKDHLPKFRERISVVLDEIVAKVERS